MSRPTNSPGQAYEQLGIGYTKTRGSDPYIQAQIFAALGSARSVLNVGAGTGSYEPVDRKCVAVEPSTRMIAQRASGSAPVVRAMAESLPFASQSIDVATAILTIHHWTDQAAGISELRRVARNRVVVLTWDPEAQDRFWLTRDYFPEALKSDVMRFDQIESLLRSFGPVKSEVVPIPHDCSDGLLGAFWRRPSAYLTPHVRRATSLFALVERGVLEQRLGQLRSDIDSGAWEERYPDLLEASEIDLGYRLMSLEIAPAD